MLAFLSCHLMYNIILVSCGYFPLTCNWQKLGWQREHPANDPTGIIFLSIIYHKNRPKVAWNHRGKVRLYKNPYFLKDLIIRGFEWCESKNKVRSDPKPLKQYGRSSIETLSIQEGFLTNTAKLEWDWAGLLLRHTI